MSRMLAGLAACVAVCIAAAPTLAQDAGILTLGPAVRAYGMGEAGVADRSDPLNAFYNPAVIAASGGVFLSGMYGQLVPELGSNVYIWHAATGGAASLVDGESIDLRLGGSVDFSYLYFGDWWPEYEPNNTVCTGRTLSEKELSVALGGEAVFGRTLHLGIGFAAKPLWIRAWPPCERDAVDGNGIAFDCGVLLSADLLRDAPWRISPSAGFSARNLGRDIDVWGRQGGARLPRAYRLGAGLRLEGPKSGALEKITGREVPLIVLNVDGDLFDVAGNEDGNGDGGAGAEAALLQTLFARVGWVREFSGDAATYGIGLGLATARFAGRMDYASVPQSRELGRVDKVGLSIGLGF